MVHKALIVQVPQGAYAKELDKLQLLAALQYFSGIANEGRDFLLQFSLGGKILHPGMQCTKCPHPTRCT